MIVPIHQGGSHEARWRKARLHERRIARAGPGRLQPTQARRQCPRFVAGRSAAWGRSPEPSLRRVGRPGQSPTGVEGAVSAEGLARWTNTSPHSLAAEGIPSGSRSWVPGRTGNRPSRQASPPWRTTSARRQPPLKGRMFRHNQARRESPATCADRSQASSVIPCHGRLSWGSRTSSECVEGGCVPWRCSWRGSPRCQQGWLGQTVRTGRLTLVLPLAGAIVSRVR